MKKKLILILLPICFYLLAIPICYANSVKNNNDIVNLQKTINNKNKEINNLKQQNNNQSKEISILKQHKQKQQDKQYNKNDKYTNPKMIIGIILGIIIPLGFIFSIIDWK